MKKENELSILESIINFIFFRWDKWELYEENRSYTKTNINPITQFETAPVSVIVDIYKRTNKYTGEVQYKKVIKS